MSEDKQEVDFSEANIDTTEKAILLDGVKIECGEGRRVEVWKVKDGDGFCVRIFRPTKDGKVSKLVFGLTPPAAIAMRNALDHHIKSCFNKSTDVKSDCDEDESLIQMAAEVVIDEQSGSVSLIQRRLRLGYTRAERIMTELEHRAIVGPSMSGGKRDVLVEKKAD